MLALNTISWSSQCTNTSTPSPLPTTLVALTFKLKLSLKNCSPSFRILFGVSSHIQQHFFQLLAGILVPYLLAGISSGTDCDSLFELLSIAEQPNNKRGLISAKFINFFIVHLNLKSSFGKYLGKCNCFVYD